MEQYGARQQYTGNKPDEGLFVEFYMGSLKNDSLSEKEGRPVFEDKPFVIIAIPGNKDEIQNTVAWLDPDHPRSHVSRFPNAWARFKANQNGEGEVGTPLKEWAAVTRSQVDTLLHYKIRTVEQLANVTDANLQNIPHGLALRQKAQEFLTQAISAENLKTEVDKLKAQLAAMVAPVVSAAQPEVAIINPVAVPPRRRRGRPPKVRTEVQPAAIP